MGKRNKYAVIVAGGKGIRMGSIVPKQYMPLADKPVLFYTINAFFKAYDDIRIVLVHAIEDAAYIQEILQYFPHQKITLIHGGETRFHSVKNGLQAIEDPAIVFVHDGVRPLISTGLIHRCYAQALSDGNAIPALPLRESIRKVENGKNFATDRTSFRIIQTPQTFLSEILLPAFDLPFENGFTDEASVVEKSGQPLYLVEGEEQNIKITCPMDLWLAEQLLLKKKE